MELRRILERFKSGEISLDDAIELIDDGGYEELGFAKIDHSREKRRGFPEVLFCQGKTVDQIVEIMRSLVQKHDNVLATRASQEIFEKVKEFVPDVKYNPVAKTMVVEKNPLPKVGKIIVVSAGTSDLPVVEEVRESAAVMGNNVDVLIDVGVAGIHRLLRNIGKLKKARVIVVVAGMDGALPSVVAGLVDKPVVAVPTSIGYGANFGGIAALLTMLNNCSGGIGVVNIDNGFGAAQLASLINKVKG